MGVGRSRLSGETLGGVMSRPLQLYDVVRVIKLLDPNRPFLGTKGCDRPPRVGDIGVYYLALDPNDAEAPVCVECVNDQGYTIWDAEFYPQELEFVRAPA